MTHPFLRSSIRSCASIAMICLASCENHSPSMTDSDSEAGRVDISIQLRKPGLLARTLSMDPTRLALDLRSDAGDSLSDTISVHNASQINSLYYLAGNRMWTLTVHDLDQRDSILHQGATRFAILPKRTTPIDISLDPLYSHLSLRIPRLQSTTRIYVQIDGSLRIDTSFLSSNQTSSAGDTLAFELDYIAASPSGTTHKLNIGVDGPFRGHNVTYFQLSKDIIVRSGENISLQDTLEWVGDLPTEGFISLGVALGLSGSIKFTTLYGATGNQHAIDNKTGRLYGAIRIGKRWWLTKNIDLGKFDDPSGTKFDSLHFLSACPSGWHVPDTGEWMDLVRNTPLSASIDSTAPLRTASGWIDKTTDSASPGYDGTNSVGFWMTPSHAYSGALDPSGATRPWNLTMSLFWTSTPQVPYFAVDPWHTGMIHGPYEKPKLGIRESEAVVRCVGDLN